MTESPPTSATALGLPLWLVLELTYRCPLQCSWCNNPLDYERYRQEMSTADWIRLLEQGRKAGAVQLGFSGGEPLLRDDLEELVATATQLGYYTNLITSGIGLTEQRLDALIAGGLKQVQLSLQANDASLCDTLVGVPSSFEQKITVARAIKARGLPMVLNVPLTRPNIDQVGSLIDLTVELGIDFVEFANVQYYNWALINRSELLPSREQIAAAEQVVIAARARLGRSPALYFVVPDYYSDRPKACMNGWGKVHLTIAPDGTAMPCQEAKLLKGIDFPNVRDHDLTWIWRDSPGFRKFRGEDWMKEPCRSCDERHVDFGGCRCQAFMLTGDAANTDPACSKSPHHHLMVEAAAIANDPRRNQAPLVMRTRKSSRQFAE